MIKDKLCKHCSNYIEDKYVYISASEIISNDEYGYAAGAIGNYLYFHLKCFEEVAGKFYVDMLFK